MIKRTFALAIGQTFNLSAARETLVVVRFAVRAAHRFVVFRTNTRTYAINQIRIFNAVSWHGVSYAASSMWDRALTYTQNNICGGNYYCVLTQSSNAHDKRTFCALAVFPASDVSAARGTLVAVRFVVQAANWFIVLRAIARNYAIDQTHIFNTVFVARRVTRSFKYVE